MTNLQIIKKTKQNRFDTRLSPVSIEGRLLCHFRFANDIDHLEFNCNNSLKG